MSGVAKLLRMLADGHTVLVWGAGAEYEQHDGTGRKVGPTFTEPDRPYLQPPGHIAGGAIEGQRAEAAHILVHADIVQHAHDLSDGTPGTDELTVLHEHPNGSTRHAHAWVEGDDSVAGYCCTSGS